MTPTELFADNLKVLRPRLPALDALLETSGKTGLQLVASPDDGHFTNTIIGGRLFYPEDARSWSVRQAVDYIRDGEALRLVPSVVPPENDVVHAAFENVYRDYGARIEGDANAYRLPERYCRVLAVLGLGLGYHLQRLLDAFDIRHLLIHEPIPEIFVASLYAVEWRRVVERLDQRRGQLVLSIGTDPATASTTFLRALDAASTFELTGLRVYLHYDTPALQAAGRAFDKGLALLMTNFGYYKDEKRQLLQTLSNLGRAAGILRSRPARRVAGDAAIVASGPSLDRTLPDLVRIRDRVVLFSCGSSLRVLMRAGIRPDFHVELETDPAFSKFFDYWDGDSHFGQIPLITANGMAESITSHFERFTLFLREHNTAASLLGPTDQHLTYCGPTVGNTALALASRLGFRRIFAFGLDLGYPQASAHHARGTVYFDEDKGSFRSDLGHIGLEKVDLSSTLTEEFEIRSNTGGRYFTNRAFLTALISVQSLAAAHADVEIVQCGFGAHIAGTRALESSELGEANTAGLRAEGVHGVLTAFGPLPAHTDVAAALSRLVDAVTEIKSDLRRQDPGAAVSLDDAMDRMGDVLATVRAAEASHPAAHHLLKGLTQAYWQAASERMLMLDGPYETDRRRFLAIAWKHFLVLLDQVDEEMREVARRHADPR